MQIWKWPFWTENTNIDYLYLALSCSELSTCTQTIQGLCLPFASACCDQLLPLPCLAKASACNLWMTCWQRFVPFNNTTLRLPPTDGAGPVSAQQSRGTCWGEDLRVILKKCVEDLKDPKTQILSNLNTYTCCPVDKALWRMTANTLHSNSICCCVRGLCNGSYEDFDTVQKVNERQNRSNKNSEFFIKSLLSASWLNIFFPCMQELLQKWLSARQTWDIHWQKRLTYMQCLCNGWLDFCYRLTTTWLSVGQSHGTDNKLTKLTHRCWHRKCEKEKVRLWKCTRS